MIGIGKRKQKPVGKSFQTAFDRLSNESISALFRLDNCIDKIPGSDSNLNFFMTLAAVFHLYSPEIPNQYCADSPTHPPQAAIATGGQRFQRDQTSG
jgi:hypothetical protein